MSRKFGMLLSSAVVGIALGYRIGCWVVHRGGGQPIVVYHGYAGPADP